MDSSTGGAKARGIRRQDIRAAVAKAAELRALHAALLQGGVTSGSPSVAGFDAGSSPSVSCSTDHFAVPEDYPVFAPTYEDDPLPGYQYRHHEHRSLSQTWSAIGLEEGRGNEAIYFCNNCTNKLSQSNGALYIPSLAEHLSSKTSRINRMPQLKTAKEYGNLKPSSRIYLGEHRQVTRHPVYDTGKQGPVVNLEVGGDGKNLKNVVASRNVEQSAKMHSKSKGQILSWLFLKSRKKTKPEMSPKVAESDMSQHLKDWGVLSLESLKNELTEANENRDAALLQASEMRSSLAELQQKLVNLELYCQELKKALKQAMQANSSQGPERSNLTRMNFASGQKECLTPVSEEVVAEGFLQLAYEARLSVKQFCKKLLKQIEETDDDDLADKINNLLQSYQISRNSKYSKEVIYHLEALVNQSLYQDFDNCVFRTNGSPNFLDPWHECRENFSSFVSLRNLSWSEVLQKGAKHYSDDFCKFCDQKMSSIASILNWSRPWPEELLQCFFITAKCIWLLHLLAFSFIPPLTILRVNENRVFDPIYMEEIPLGRHKAPAPAPVKIMVMPGFYIQDSVLKCRVICKRTLA